MLPKSLQPLARLAPPPLEGEVRRHWSRPNLQFAKRRMVLFLARDRSTDSEPTVRWRGAVYGSGEVDGSGCVADVVWIDKDRVFAAVQLRSIGGHDLIDRMSLAELREVVELGTRLRDQFDRAVAEPDLKKRSDRLFVLTPAVAHYAPMYATDASFHQLRRCGKSAVPALLRFKWGRDFALWPKAVSALCELNDDAFPEIIGVVNDELQYWLHRLDGLQDPEWIDRVPHTEEYKWRSMDSLHGLLRDLNKMRPSSANAARLAELPRLKSFDKLLTTEPLMTPKGTPMVRVHTLVKSLREKGAKE